MTGVQFIDLYAGQCIRHLANGAWYGALALALAWLICQLWRFAPARFHGWLWKVAYLKLFVATLWIPHIELPWLPPPKRQTVGDAGDFKKVETLGTLAEYEVPDRSTAYQPAERSSTGADAMRDARPHRLASTTRIVVLVVWLLGVLCSMAIVVRHWFAMRTIQNSSRPMMHREIREVFDECVKQMRVRQYVHLVHYAHIHVPIVMGILRPHVVLPTAMLPAYTKEQLRVIFLHELAHVRSGDLLWNWVPTIAQVIFFFHPLVWIGRRGWRLAHESVADELAIRSSSLATDVYARCLIEVVVDASADACPSWGLAMGEAYHHMRHRVMALSAIGGWSPHAMRCLAVCTMMVAVVGVVPWRLTAQDVTGGESLTEASPPESGQGVGDEIADIATIPTRVYGRVVGPDGLAVSNATVHVVSNSYVGEMQPIRQKIVATLTTDVDGHFDAQAPLPVRDGDIDSRQFGIRCEQIVVTAQGLSPAFTSLGQSRRGEPIAISLSHVSSPIQGRLVDGDGRPMVGVEVVMSVVYDPREQLPSVLSSLEKLAGMPQESLSDDFTLSYHPSPPSVSLNEKSLTDRLQYPSVGLPGTKRTDTNGYFEFPGVGVNRFVAIDIADPRIVSERISLLSHERAPINAALFALQRVRRTYGVSFEHIVKATDPIPGEVRDIDSGKPIAGVRVATQPGVYWVADGEHTQDPFVSAMSGVRGEFVLNGLGRRKYRELSVVVPPSECYFSQNVPVPESGSKPNPYTILLKRGRWIEGKVRDRVTGQGVEARVGFVPRKGNPAALEHSLFRGGRTSMPDSWELTATSPDGTYRLVGTPGEGVVFAIADDRRYRAGIGMDELIRNSEGASKGQSGLLDVYRWGIDAESIHTARSVLVSADEESTSCDLELDPGAIITLQLKDAQGRELLGVRSRGEYDGVIAARQFHYSAPHDNSTISIFGSSSARPRSVFLLHEERGLSGLVVCDTDRDETRQVTLWPHATIRGRLVDRQGNPVRDEPLSLRPATTKQRELSHAIGVSDQQGAFVLERCVAKMELALISDIHREVLATVTLESGQSLDLGEVSIEHPSLIAENQRAMQLTRNGRHHEALNVLEAMLNASPGHDGALRDRARALRALKRYSEALREFERLLVKSPTEPRLQLHVAELLASSPIAADRNGRRALSLANDALATWQRESVPDGEGRAMQAMAAAYAELGEFDRAIHYQQQALPLLESNADAVARGREWLERYQAKEPCRLEADGTTP